MASWSYDKECPVCKNDAFYTRESKPIEHTNAECSHCGWFLAIGKCGRISREEFQWNAEQDIKRGDFEYNKPKDEIKERMEEYDSYNGNDFNVIPD